MKFYKPFSRRYLIRASIPMLFLLLVTGCAGSSMAGTGEEPTITVSATAEVLVPADVVNMSITIGITAETAEKAFNRHEEKESFLAGLLKELQFEDENISFQPMSIRPNRQRDGSIFTNTSQRISIKLEDFDLFMNLQKTLIDNGFDNFSASFYSTEYEQGGNQALAKAVEHARQDAEIMAEAAGSRLGNVVKIEHVSHESHRPAQRMELSAATLADSHSLMDIAQTISVKKSVVVVFRLEN